MPSTNEPTGRRPSSYDAPALVESILEGRLATKSDAQPPLASVSRMTHPSHSAMPTSVAGRRPLFPEAALNRAITLLPATRKNGALLA